MQFAHPIETKWKNGGSLGGNYFGEGKSPADRRRGTYSVLPGPFQKSAGVVADRRYFSLYDSYFYFLMSFDMDEKVFDVIVVGAGYAGLAASYHLTKYGVAHIVFERCRIGESWRSQRWDSFKTNSTNKLNVLPGQTWQDETADEFATATQLVSSFEQYAITHRLPVAENSNVISVESSGRPV